MYWILIKHLRMPVIPKLPSSTINPAVGGGYVLQKVGFNSNIRVKRGSSFVPNLLHGSNHLSDETDTFINLIVLGECLCPSTVEIIANCYKRKKF